MRKTAVARSSGTRSASRACWRTSRCTFRADAVARRPERSSPAFSRHHFHRQFSGFLGMSAYRYVQFMRMRRASWRLAIHDRRPRCVTIASSRRLRRSPKHSHARSASTRASHRANFATQPDWTEWHSRFRPFIQLRQTTMSTHRSAAGRASDHISRDSRGETRASRQRAAAAATAFASSSSGARLTNCRRTSAPRSTSFTTTPTKRRPRNSASTLCAATDRPIRRERCRRDRVPDSRRSMRAVAASRLRRSARQVDHASVRAAGCRPAAKNCATSRCSCSERNSFPTCRTARRRRISTCRWRRIEKGQTLSGPAPFLQELGMTPSSADADGQEQLRALALEQDGHGLRTVGRGVLELGDGLHRLAIDAEDDVAGTHAGLRGRTRDVLDQ